MPGRPQEVKDANCSADLARKILNYQTKTILDDGLRELVTWIKNQGTKQFTYHLPLEFITNKTPKTWIDKLI
jgi:UDP-glucose 4-epimerase